MRFSESEPRIWCPAPPAADNDPEPAEDEADVDEDSEVEDDPVSGVQREVVVLSNRLFLETTCRTPCEYLPICQG